MRSAAGDVASLGLKLKWKPVKYPESIYRELVTMSTQPAKTGLPSTSEL